MSHPIMQDLLASIYDRIQQRPDLEESEVTDVFTDHDFFQELGYDGIPIDVRSEKHIVGGDRPDYFCKDKYGNVIFVVEFKKPSNKKSLSSHKGQLWNQYVVPMRASYGVLTDGEDLILYERGSNDQRQKKLDRALNDISDEHVQQLLQLRKPQLEFDSKQAIEQYFADVDPVSVGESVDGENVGQNEFFDTFRLEHGTIFYDMLERTFDLINYYVETGDPGNFPKDAYEFWQDYYASNPSWNDIPDEWKEIAGTASNKQRLMFAVETVQSILGRLMLAKACEDYDFPNISIERTIEQETIDFRGSVPSAAYILAGKELMQRMRQELVESVFEQDIYYWWDTPAEEMQTMSPTEIHQKDWPAPVEDFSIGFIEFVVAISRFDFSNVQGDPLGELYQQYFDPKTRRALGEFYTPPSICDYILDSVDYNQDVTHRRLIDPSCGSGTFLVEALKRYKQDVDEDTDWSDALQSLCDQSHIVGLDIHPFAVVLAQIRFMLEILPEYKQAIDEDPQFVLRRLPIYRTDSLIDESEAEEGRQQTFGASYEEGMVEFTMPLPIRKGSEFETMDFEFPQYDDAVNDTNSAIGDRQDYFTALAAVFDAVKDNAAEENYKIKEHERDQLESYFKEYFDSHKNTAQITETFHGTANGFLDTVKELREEYNDGRLLKLIEDLVLGATLKNDIPYHYVVGNPPWVSKHSRHRDEEQRRRMKQLYLSRWKEHDVYMLFMERGMKMLEEGGEMGYIIPNRVFSNKNAKEIRGLLAKNRVKEIVDFTDYQLFEGATNYSAIVTVEKQAPNNEWSSFIEDGAFTNTHNITAARVRDWDGDIPGMISQLQAREPTDSVDFYTIDSSRWEERVEVQSDSVRREKVSENFTDTEQMIELDRELPLVDVWPVSTPSEFSILDSVEDQMEMRLGDKPAVRENEQEQIGNLVGDHIHEGIATSGDGAYVVNPVTGIEKEKLKELDHLTVTPKATDEEFTVETDLLKVDITGEDADRWLPDWSNRLVFVPYEQGEERADPIRPAELESSYEDTWAYFTDPSTLQILSDESKERKELHGRLAAEFGVIDERSPDSKYRQVDFSESQFEELSQKLRQNADYLDRQDEEFWWYRFLHRKNIEELPNPKVLTGNQAPYNKLSFDDEGLMAPHNARVYAILLSDEIKHAVAGVLNSSLIEFYHKQHARIHRGKVYSYIEDYTSKWPVVIPEGEERNEIEQLVDHILELKDLEIKIAQFPDPYIVEYREASEEFPEVVYTPSEDYVANPEVQPDIQGSYGIEVEDGNIDDSLIDTREKALYVQEALDGQKMEKNTTTTLPVPLSDGIAEEVLEELKEDRNQLATTSIRGLEDKIDDVVFELFGIDSADDQERVRRYNSQWDTIRSIDPS